jgi:hypothetical protein
MKNLISIPVILVIFLTILGCNFGARNESPKTENNTTPPVAQKTEEASSEKPIRSTELIEAFKKDKDGANAKYKDKIILISGKITNINDVFGVKALNLRDSENEMGLQTYLANKADVEKVKVGDEVTVRGKVRGDGLDVIDNAVIIKVN